MCLHLCLLFILQFGFALTVELSKAAPLVAFQALSNLILSHRRRHLSPLELGLVIHGDILLLTALLHLTGGAANPFSILFLVYVFLSAIFLTPRWTYSTSLFSSLCFALLLFESPSQSSLHIHHEEALLSLHLHGMWVAYLVVAFLSTYFLTKIMEALQRQQKAFLELERLRADDEKLVSLATLAAGAGHELATPLSSIALASSELHEGLQEGISTEHLIRDVHLIQREVQRCKRILEMMAFKGGGHRGEVIRKVYLQELQEELLTRITLPHRVSIKVDAPQAAIFVYREALLQALTALITNALDAADECRVIMREDEEHAIFEVRDAGPGISDEVLMRIGDPFFTTKAPGKGTGLGLFLVRQLVEEWKGELSLASNSEGTVVQLKLPLNRDEV